MSRCIDKRLGDKLYAYELGMLSGSEREEFELHLMECEYCSKRAERFQKAAILLRQDDDVKEKIRTLAEGEESSEPEFKATPVRKRTALVRLLAATFIVVLVVIAVILKPWRLEFSPTHEAVAASDLLAIMYFENQVDPDDSLHLGEIATNLLITDLSESRFIRIVSSQQVFDILRFLGKDDVKAISNDIAAEIAEKSNARWMLVGSILQTDPRLVITTQMIDVESGQVVSSQKIAGDEGEDIFSLVDKLTIKIKNDLRLPLEAKDEQDRAVADITTHSREAYRSYIEGISLYNRFYREEAERSFERVLELDSTFAMAYYYLAELKDRALIKRAVDYSEGVSERDRFLILSRNAVYSRDYDYAAEILHDAIARFPQDKTAYYMLGNLKAILGKYDETIPPLIEATRIDPLYEEAFNLLAYSYSFVDSIDRAIEAIDLYISLAPDDANPYDSKGDILTRGGRFEEAAEFYQKALAIKPDFYTSLKKLGDTYLRLRAYSEAESCAVALKQADNAVARSDGRLIAALVPLSRGKVSNALTLLDDGINQDRIELSGLNLSKIAMMHYIKAGVYAATDKPDSAVSEIERAIDVYLEIDPNDEESYRCYYTGLLVQNGEYEKAERVHEAVNESQGRMGRREPYFLYGAAFIELSRGNPEAAIDSLKRFLDDRTDVIGSFELGKILLDMERYGEAINVFEELTDNSAYKPLIHIYYLTLSHYYAGLANELNGSISSAVAHYERFLDVWLDADPDIIEVREAESRLDNLRAGT